MKILLIGRNSGKPEEGMRNTALEIIKWLSTENEVRLLSPEESLWQINDIRDWQPDIVHYITGPSLRSFFVLRAIEKYSGCHASIMSFIHPICTPWQLRLVALALQPTLSLAWSKRWLRRLEEANIRATFFASAGVNTNRFCPVSQETKRKYRSQFGFGTDEHILLSVGHIKADRNYQALCEVASVPNVRLVVIGSGAFSNDRKMATKLVKAGIDLRIGFVKELEAFYQASDCYLFPVINEKAAIHIPLSVLEALACGLPVISTDYGGLKDILGNNSAVSFRQNTPDSWTWKSILEHINGNRKVQLSNTFSWPSICNMLRAYYDEAVCLSNERTRRAIR